ncbi:MAG: hypothetical protein ABIE55_03345 [Candidatus Aenigmatarchaeota archaeon]
MAIKPVCSKCDNELKEFGGILFSPPDDDDMTKKWHLCKSCYESITDDFV